MVSGIYLIENVASQKKYVGQSMNVKVRFGKHKCYLKHNKHENRYLQRSYDKYGVENFRFEILEMCSVEDLDEREIYYIEHFNTLDINKGYNLESGGNKGKIVSELTRLKKIGENNPMYGKKLSKETRKLISDSAKGNNNILTEKEVVEIKELLVKGVSQGEISEMYGVHFSTISKIATFKNWGYLRPDLNEKYLETLNARRQIIENNVLKLHDLGKSLRDIQKITGVDRRKSSKIIRQHRDN